MTIYLNPHTPNGSVSDIISTLRVSYNIFLKITGAIDLLKERASKNELIIKSILQAWYTDLLAVISQLKNIEFLNSINPAEDKILLNFNLPYNLMDQTTGQPVFKEDYLERYAIKYHQVDFTEIKHSNSIQMPLNYKLKVSKIVSNEVSDQSLWIVDNKWSSKLQQNPLLKDKQILQFNHLKQEIILTNLNNENKITFFDGDPIAAIKVDFKETQNLTSTFRGVLDRIVKTVQKELVKEFNKLDPVGIKNLIKSSLLNMWNTYIHFALVMSNLLNLLPLEAIIQWNDWYPPGQVIGKLAEKMGIKRYTFQHGMFLYEPVYLLSRSEEYFVYNEIESRKLETLFTLSSHSPDIEQIGYPLDIPSKALPVQIEYDIVVIMQLLALTPEMKQLLQYLVKLKNDFPFLEILIRKHPRDSNTFWKDKAYTSTFAISDQSSLIDDLARAKIVIGINSSALLEAALMGKHVLEYKYPRFSISYLQAYTINNEFFSNYKELYQIFQKKSSKLFEKDNLDLSNFITYHSFLNKVNDSLARS